MSKDTRGLSYYTGLIFQGAGINGVFLGMPKVVTIAYLAAAVVLFVACFAARKKEAE